MPSRTTKRAIGWGLVGGLASLSLILHNLHPHGLDFVQPVSAYQWGYDASRVLIVALLAIDMAGISILLYQLSRSGK